MALSLLAVVRPVEASPPPQAAERITEAMFRAELQRQNATGELAEFNTLPPGLQDKLIDYLNDEQVLAEALTASGDASLHGGDVTVTDEYEEIDEPANVGSGSFAMATLAMDVGDRMIAAIYCCRTGTYHRYVHIFGIKIIRISVWVQYKHNGTYATSVVQSGSYWYNYNPIWSLSRENWRPWISSGYAYGRTDWRIVTGINGYGVTSHIRQTVKSRPGRTTGWTG